LTKVSFIHFFSATILFLATTFNPLNAVGQNENDSLLRIIDTETNDSIKLSAIFKFAENITDTYPDSAYLLLEDANYLISKTENTSYKIKILNLKSVVFQNLGKYPEALELLFEAKNFLESQDGSLNDTTYFLDYLQVLSSIGIIYYNIEKFDESLEYFHSGLEFLNTLNDSYPKKSVDNEYFRYNLNCGAVYTKIRDFEKAEFFFTKALQYLEEDNKRNYGVLLNNLSIVARENDNIEKAFDLNLKAIESSKEANNPRALTQSYNNLGSCYVYIKDFKNALKNYETALDMAEKYGFTRSIAIPLEAMSNVYDSIGDYKNAYLTHLQFKAINDSLTDIDKVHLVTQLEMQEKFEKRMTMARLQRQEIEAEQNKRELIYVLVIVFIAMGLIIAFLLYYLQRSKSKRHRLEAEKNALLNKSLNLEKTTLEEELEFKNKELATNVMYMIRKNELITQISEKLIKSKLGFKKENQKIVEEIIRELQSSTDDDVWTEFEIRFQQVHNDFYNTLNVRFPNLSANEKRLCAFLRLNMSTKEISAITYQSINSLTVARSRLRKKLDLDSDENLIAFLESI